MTETCPDCGLRHDMTECIANAYDCDCCRSIRGPQPLNDLPKETR
jgi:hypothetical protein